MKIKIIGMINCDLKHFFLLYGKYIFTIFAVEKGKNKKEKQSNEMNSVSIEWSIGAKCKTCFDKFRIYFFILSFVFW